ncbi:MAG: hypothetical protein EPN20_16660, partial [Magnetospirillum sp.]
MWSTSQISEGTGQATAPLDPWSSQSCAAPGGWTSYNAARTEWASLTSWWSSNPGYTMAEPSTEKFTFDPGVSAQQQAAVQSTMGAVVRNMYGYDVMGEAAWRSEIAGITIEVRDLSAKGEAGHSDWGVVDGKVFGKIIIDKNHLSDDPVFAHELKHILTQSGHALNPDRSAANAMDRIVEFDQRYAVAAGSQVVPLGYLCDFDPQSGLFALKPSPVAHPLVLDLDGNGIQLTALDQSRTFFDIDGDGFLENTGWAAGNDGILAIDLDGDGRIAQADEFVFTRSAPGTASDL